MSNVASELLLVQLHLVSLSRLPLTRLETGRSQIDLPGSVRDIDVSTQRRFGGEGDRSPEHPTTPSWSEHWLKDVESMSMSGCQ